MMKGKTQKSSSGAPQGRSAPLRLQLTRRRTTVVTMLSRGQPVRVSCAPINLRRDAWTDRSNSSGLHGWARLFGPFAG
eukprot:1650921-Rhodomonas_salina.2